MLGRLALVTVLVSIILAFGAPSSWAVGGYRVYATGGIGVRVWSGPGTYFTQFGALGEGTPVDIQCQTWGQNINGSRVWDKLNGPIHSYVTDYYINTPVFAGFSPGIPQCSDTDLFRDDDGYRPTDIYDPGHGNTISYAMFASPAFQSFYNRYGFDSNYDIWAPIVTFNAGGAVWLGCNTTTSYHTGNFCPIGTLTAPVNSIVPSGVITAKLWNGAFIGIYCGNNTPSGAAGPMPTISGAKYEDRNANDGRDPGEPGLSGWTIQLYYNGNFITQTNTDGNGNYSFTLNANSLPISAGNYEVKEVLKPGYRQTAAPAGPIVVPFGAAATVYSGRDFGNYRLPNISISDAPPVKEGTGAADAHSAKFTLSLDQATGKDITVRFKTSDGTAVAPDDYAAADTTVTIPSGSTSVEVPVAIVPDALPEDNETFSATISEPSDGQIVRPVGQATILDDDRSPMSCRASVLRLTGTEPIVANPAGRPCAADSQGAPHIDSSNLGVPAPVAVSADVLRAKTTQNYSPADPTRDGDVVTAEASLASVAIKINGGVVIAADAVTSKASSTCLNNAAMFDGSSRIAGLSVIGQSIDARDSMDVDLGPIGILHINSETRSATGMTVRALWLQTASGQDVVVGESVVGVDRFSCRG